MGIPKDQRPPTLRVWPLISKGSARGKRFANLQICLVECVALENPIPGPAPKSFDVFIFRELRKLSHQHYAHKCVGRQICKYIVWQIPLVTLPPFKSHQFVENFFYLTDTFLVVYDWYAMARVYTYLITTGIREHSLDLLLYERWPHSFYLSSFLVRHISHRFRQRVPMSSRRRTCTTSGKTANKFWGHNTEDLKEKRQPTKGNLQRKMYF